MHLKNHVTTIFKKMKKVYPTIGNNRFISFASFKGKLLLFVFKSQSPEKIVNACAH